MKVNRKLDCLEDLRSRILTMAIAPGADLDEAVLSETYGVSRTPLREVLQRLAGEGYVTLTENRGAKVASMDLPVVRAFFQTAPLVYSSIARLAAENRTVAQVDELKAIQTRFVRSVCAGRAGEIALENHRFHGMIGVMAVNDYLTPSLRRLLIDHTRLGQIFYRPASPAESLAVRISSDQHDAMIAAIETGDSDGVVDLTLQHWALSRDRLERFVHPDPMPLDIADLKERHHAI